MLAGLVTSSTRINIPYFGINVIGGWVATLASGAKVEGVTLGHRR